MRLPIAALLLACLALPARAGEFVVEVLVLRQPEPAPAVWAPGAPALLPCDTVRLRPGGGAEAAFTPGGEPCRPRDGRSVLPMGLNALPGAALGDATNRLRSKGYAVLSQAHWRQSTANGVPVLLAGNVGDLGLAGTVALSGDEDLPTVSLDLGLASGGETPMHARLQAVRRLKPGELNYFDHPLFGALVRVQANGAP